LAQLEVPTGATRIVMVVPSIGERILDFGLANFFIFLDHVYMLYPSPLDKVFEVFSG
jgi:hypothetical protein